MFASQTALSVALCLATFIVLFLVLRRKRPSLGIPLAFLALLFVYHLPGAIAHVVASPPLPESEVTERGISLTSLACMCFALGVWIGRLPRGRPNLRAGGTRQTFWLFCLFGGWLVAYGISPLLRIPSIGAAIEKGEAIWMLGVMLGLRATVRAGNVKAALWAASMMVFPILMLLLGGFMSYGMAAVFICLAPLLVSTRSKLRIAAATGVISFVIFSLFLSYLLNRDEIREAVWGGENMESRVDSAMGMVRDFRIFDPTSEKELEALDERLNQNYFVGIAAERIDDGANDYLLGRSVWEGIIALVPRIVWPAKPVSAGSPGIIMEMTGLQLSETTAWGVGPVMESYINFGAGGIVAGFIILGSLLGYLDMKAAAAEANGNVSRLLRSFLPAVALIQPLGSIVEMTSGAVAAWIAAVGWTWIWNQWCRSTGQKMNQVPRRLSNITDAANTSRLANHKI